MEMRHLAPARRKLTQRGLVAAASWLLVLGLSACSKPNPEEQFRLWCNNEEGWSEIGKYVADKNNDTKLRVRALELLAMDGHPSEVLKASEKAPDRLQVRTALVPLMLKMLEDGNPKRQGYAKRVLFELIKDGGLPEDKATELKRQVAKWAFGDFSHDTPIEAIRDKLKDRITPVEIEVLGNEATAGVEVMLGKGLQKAELVAFLRGLKTPEAAKALVGGLRQYHSGKNIKITDDDLGAIQSTNSIDGLLYFLELYATKVVQAKPGTKLHPDDQRAADLAIRVAIEYADPEDKKVAAENQAKIKAAWPTVGPAVEQLLASPNCDDRWWAMQLFTTHGGAEGFKQALAKLPDDDLYGKGPPHGDNDVKKLLMDLCTTEVKQLGAEAVRPVLETALTSSPRLIERIVAARCLLALGDQRSTAVLQAFNKKDPLASKTVQPVVNVPKALDLAGLVANAAAAAGYLAEIDRLGAEGKIEAATAKWRKYYGLYLSFERQGKELAAEAEPMADEKVAKDKAKQQGAK